MISGQSLIFLFHHFNIPSGFSLLWCRFWYILWWLSYWWWRWRCLWSFHWRHRFHLFDCTHRIHGFHLLKAILWNKFISIILQIVRITIQVSLTCSRNWLNHSWWTSFNHTRSSTRRIRVKLRSFNLLSMSRLVCSIYFSLSLSFISSLIIFLFYNILLLSNRLFQIPILRPN